MFLFMYSYHVVLVLKFASCIPESMFSLKQEYSYLCVEKVFLNYCVRNDFELLLMV